MHANNEKLRVERKRQTTALIADRLLAALIPLLLHKLPLFYLIRGREGSPNLGQKTNGAINAGKMEGNNKLTVIYRTAGYPCLLLEVGRSCILRATICMDSCVQRVCAVSDARRVIGL